MSPLCATKRQALVVLAAVGRNFSGMNTSYFLLIIVLILNTKKEVVSEANTNTSAELHVMCIVVERSYR